jgi:hypothetical protein
MNLPKSNYKIIATVLVLLIAIMGVAGNAFALMLEKSLEEVSTGADSIIVGKVLQKQSHWNRDKTQIYTRVVISTEERLKGSAHSGNVTLVIPGGKIGDTTLQVTDTPDFTVGENVTVFIRSLTDTQAAAVGVEKTGDTTPLYRIHGGTQGKYLILNDKVGRLPLMQFKERISNALTGRIQEYPENEKLLNTESALSAPMIYGITPSSASAGTNTMITISGTNLGASAGTPFFFYKYSDYYGCPFCVFSWTDSDAVVNVPIFNASGGYPASAGSGPFYLKNLSGDQSNSLPFAITFSYGGVKWTNPSATADFQVNANGDPFFLKAIQDAANTWNAVPNKNFSLIYSGPTTAATANINQINEIIWADLQDSSIIGQTSILSTGDAVEECDITFNTKFKWSTSVPTPSGFMDVQTVALHELGHWLNLRDLYGKVSGFPTDIDKVMYGFSRTGTQKRSLTLYDSLGIRYIYPSTNPCAASLSLSDSAYHLFIPILDTSPNLWVDFQCDLADSSKIMFKLTNSGETTNPEGFNACQPASLSSMDADYILHIPAMIFNGDSYRVDLTYVPTTDGLIWFMLTSAWAN